MTEPPWFLVTGLPWPEDQDDADVAEAAFAIAPDVTKAVRPVGPDGKPAPLGRDLALMLDAGSRCAAALGKGVLFISDITRWLADIELSWQRIGVDFATAEDDLEHQSPGLFLMTNEVRSSRGVQLFPIPASLHTRLNILRTFPASRAVPRWVVNTSPMSCHLSLTRSRSWAWLSRTARRASTAIWGRPRVRRDRSVLVSPCTRTDRQTAT